MDKFQRFVDLVLTSTVSEGSEIEHFANIAVAWRQDPQWLGVHKYVGGPRFSIHGWFKRDDDDVVSGGG